MGNHLTVWEIEQQKQKAFLKINWLWKCVEGMEYDCGAFIMALYLGDVYGLLSPCLFNLYAEYIMRNTGLESSLLGEISITSDMQMTPPLCQKVKRN